MICERFSASQAQEFFENPFFLFVPSFLGTNHRVRKFFPYKSLSIRFTAIFLDIR
jgi:hypothetical protein